MNVRDLITQLLDIPGLSLDDEVIAYCEDGDASFDLRNVRYRYDSRIELVLAGAP